jgi:hypothetical protein
VTIPNYAKAKIGEGPALVIPELIAAGCKADLRKPVGLSHGLGQVPGIPYQRLAPTRKIHDLCAELLRFSQNRSDDARLEFSTTLVPPNV